MRSVAATSVGDTVGATFAEEAHAPPGSGSPTAAAQAAYALGLALEGRAAREPDACSGGRRARGEVGNRWIEAFALTEVLWLDARKGDRSGARGLRA